MATELIQKLKDFKKGLDGILLDLGRFDNAYESRQSELTTLQNQITVAREEKAALDQQAKTVLDEARKEADNTKLQAKTIADAARAVSLKAAADREEARIAVENADTLRRQLVYEASLLEKEKIAVKERSQKLQEALQ